MTEVVMTDASDGIANRTIRYAVTGAAGFIGGQLCRRLLESGLAVVAVVRSDDQGEDLARLGAEIRVADVKNPDQLRSAFADCTGIYHLAALFNNPDCSWDDYRLVNVKGTLNVLTAAKMLGVSRVVYCSTVGVATEAEPPPYSEDTPYSPQPGDKYEETKAEAEQAALKYARENSLSVSVIRPAQVYGPGDRSKAKFYKLVKKGIIVNPGKTVKHLIFIDDLCHSFQLAMETPEADGHVFLIAGDESILLTDLISKVANTLDVPNPRVRVPAWPVTTMCTIVEIACNAIRIKPILFRRSMDFFTRTVECDTTKAKQVLGFSSKVSVDAGVKATSDWYRSEGII